MNIPGLVHILQDINADRLALATQDLRPNPEQSEAERLIETLFQPSQSLAVYGTLAPGAANEKVMAAIAGTWQSGQIRGHRFENSAGAAIGYPGMVWDMAASSQPVQLFQSSALPRHWSRLDEFEGEGYVRMLVPVEGPENLWTKRSPPYAWSPDATTPDTTTPDTAIPGTATPDTTIAKSPTDSATRVDPRETGEIGLMAIANLYALHPASIPH